MKPRCPELKVIQGGDELGYICKEADKWCLIEYGQPCEDYDKWLDNEYDEWKEEQIPGMPRMNNPFTS